MTDLLSCKALFVVKQPVTSFALATTSKQCSASPGPYLATNAAPVRLAHPRDSRLCSKRQMLLSGASLLLAPLLTQPAAAKPSLCSVPDKGAPTFNGFDGVGGEDADYANAEVSHNKLRANLLGQHLKLMCARLPGLLLV